MTTITKELKSVKLSELKEFPNNPNIHPEEQVKAIAKSIEKYGQYYPIVCDEKMQILCGHGKKQALDLLKRDKADVLILKGLNKKDKLKLVIEDNKIQSLSYINYGKVEDIIRAIGDVDIIGYNEEYLNAIINEVSPDNMGVDFSQKATAKDVFNKEKESAQQEEFHDIDSGTVPARTIKCPHCGKEFTI